jgi:hypothetical protein
LAEVSERMVVAVPSIRPLPDEITAFVRLADQALYAPAFAGGEAEEACRSAGRFWSWKHLMAVMSLERFATPPNAGKHLNKELS